MPGNRLNLSLDLSLRFSLRHRLIVGLSISLLLVANRRKDSSNLLE